MNRFQISNFFQEGDTVTLSATETTSNVYFGGQLDDNDKTIVVWNSGFSECFVRIGGTSIAATSTGLPIPAGTTYTLRAPSDKGFYLAGICPAGQTTTLYITPGQGV